MIGLNFDKYKCFFVCGSSHSAGGGLEEPSIRNNSFRPLYEKYYNVTWNNRTEVNFGKRLEEIIKIPCVNKAKCGVGVEYVVRTTYEFLWENWKDKNEIFLILELPNPSRAELFDNYYNEYIVINHSHTPKFSDSVFHYGTREYFIHDEMDNERQWVYKHWSKNHFNIKENMKQNDFDIVGLYSFCRTNNIKIFLMSKPNFYFRKTINVDNLINFGPTIPTDINGFCTYIKLRIVDDMNKKVDNLKIEEDAHPGFFGHIEYAKMLANYLGWDGNYDGINYRYLNENI